jgi:hypothetical protein
MPMCWWYVSSHILTGRRFFVVAVLGLCVRIDEANDGSSRWDVASVDPKGLLWRDLALACFPVCLYDVIG